MIAVSPQDGSVGAPVNARVDVQVNEAIEPLSVSSSAIQVSAGGVAVGGTVSLSSDRTVLTFTPSSPLAVSTSYAVTVSGFTDVAGNPVSPFSSSFTTGASGVADTVLLGVQSVNPLNGATGAPVNTAIALTFNKAVDPTTVSTGTMPISASGFSGDLAGTYAVTGSVVGFTPLSPLPGNTRINIEVVGGTGGVRDVAGNTGNFFFSSFTTGAGTDTAAPAILSVTPSDGAISVGRNASVVLTFSKSLNRATVNGNTFGLLDASGVSLGFGISVSADNQTVTLSPGTLPASSVVTVVATSGVKDLSGNLLPDFRSQFNTTIAPDTAHASVVAQRPGNGASGVPLASSVVVYVNEPLDPATVQNALHVSQNGVLVTGTVTVKDNGQTVEFQPAGPWLNNALVQVFLDSTALDVDGSPVNSYQGSFRTEVDTTTIAPAPVSLSPANGATNIPDNAVIELAYNEPLNPNSVNVNTVLVRQNVCCTFPAVAGTITLDATGRLIRFVPTVPLAAGSSYLAQTTTGIQGTNGLTQTFTSSTSFTTGAVQDTMPPVVTLVSPPDGAVGVPVNADIHVRFNEAINPLTVNAGTIQVMGGGQTAVASSISFRNGNQEVVLTPQEPFPDNTVMTVAVAGVEDLAGNQVVSRTTQFTSGAGPATAQPAVVQENPFSGAAGVATNTVVQLETSVPVDPGTVDSNTFVVRDNVTGQNVAGSYTVSGDGRTLSFVPGAPLAVSRSHTVIFTNGITDLAGNVVGCAVLCNYSFTTGTLADPNAPQVVGVSPADQLTGVPINAQVVIGFNEPVNQLTLGQVTLSSGGTAVSVVRTLANGQTTLILTPVVPLNAGTQYTVNVAGVQDLSGNTLSAASSTTFTTGPGADLVRGFVTTVSPANGATAVPTNAVIEVQFSKRVDALTVTDGTLRVFPSGGNLIDGTIVVSADGQSATFTPSAPLVVSTTYLVQATSGITDLEGQGLQFFQSSFVTAVQ
ncbi:MAG: Ig-like domain-containing protein [Pseudonocardiaceae bacterium]